MRKVKFALIGACLSVTLITMGSFNELQGGSGREISVTSPPSLDLFYPPKAERPIYLFAMLKLENLFSGMAADVMENDLPGARDSFRAFEMQYRKVSYMVPEWKEYYSPESVTRLGKELNGGDVGRIMTAFDKVGQSCHRCHVSTMVQVQQKYRWGDFSRMTVKDPLRREPVDYAAFKKHLSTNMAGITTDLMQGQIESARRQFAGFRQRFDTLKESCTDCHETESRYYVDAGVGKLLDRLDGVFSRDNVDPYTVMELVQSIGRESCSKCHLVHVPAALAVSDLR